MVQLIASSLIHKILPPDGRAGQQYPALVMLHGRGSNEDDLLGLAPYLDPRFFMIAARAPLQLQYGGFTWYEMPEVGSPNVEQFMASYERLLQFLEDVRSKYPVDPNRMFLLGFSMGTVLSYAIALTRPELIRGVAANSGYIPESVGLKFQWDHLAKTGFFVAHGVHDPVIGVASARRAKELLSNAKADLTYREYPIAHTMSEESVDDASHWLQQQIEATDKNRGEKSLHGEH